MKLKGVVLERERNFECKCFGVLILISAQISSKSNHVKRQVTFSEEVTSEINNIISKA